VELARSELTRSARYFERRLGEKDFAALEGMRMTPV
jgi:hypothetical protein